MGIDFLGLAIFSFIRAFAPGPNNIASMSQSVLFGFQRTHAFLIGISVGFFIVQLLCALFSAAILSAWQDAEQVLRIIGALYMLWLAGSIIMTASARLEGDSKDEEVLSFGRGLFLQFVNPKGILFGLTVFSGFLGGVTGMQVWFLVAALIFTLQTYIAISLWALAGQAIKQFLAGRVAATVIAIILALMLVIIAYNFSNIDNLWRA